MPGLYIHIPFCVSRCHYCDFFTRTCLNLIPDYTDALIDEMRAQRAFIEDVSTIYFGGGTPSLLAPWQVARLIGAAGEVWDLSNPEEVTLEANPDDLGTEYLEVLAATPVDRLSIGIQSFDDGLLRFMNRRHTAAQAIEAVHHARAAGFDNLSIDLIYGTPGMTIGQWEQTLEQAIALRPEHISAYHLTLEPGTQFAGLTPVDEAVSEQHYRLLCEKLRAGGYDHYEISNFALPGRRARHNSSYWSGRAYLGLGPSAHSYDGKRLRRWNAQSLDEYLQSVEYQQETLSDDDLHNEFVMTRLRTTQGIDRPGPDLVEHNGRWVIPEERWLVSDRIIAALFR